MVYNIIFMLINSNNILKITPGPQRQYFCVCYEVEERQELTMANEGPKLWVMLDKSLDFPTKYAVCSVI